MYTFIAHMKVASGKGAELQALLTDVRDQTLKNEPDVVYYDFSISAEDPDHYMVIEIYRNEAAQTSHMQTAWVQDSIPKTVPLIQGIEVKQYVAPDTQPVAMEMPGDFA